MVSFTTWPMDFFPFSLWFFIFIAFFSLLVEALLRRCIRSITPPEKIFRFHPFKAYEIIPNSTRLNGIHHNNYGFRGPDIDIVPTPNVTRIFLLGGSTTYDGVGPEGHHTGDFIAKELAERFPNRKFEVINAGVEGYHSLQSLITVASCVVDFSPNIIIFMHGINDAFMRLLNDFKTDYSSIYVPFIYPKAYIWEKSVILSMLFSNYTNFNNKWFPSEKLSGLAALAASPKVREYIRTAGITKEETSGNVKVNTSYAFRRNLLSLIGLSITNKFKLLLCTLPHIMPHERGKATDEHNEVVRELSAEYKIPFVDLGRELSSKDNLFYDDMHMNITGQKIKAKKIVKILTKII